MRKSAASHGGAAMVSMLVGIILVEFVKPGFPGLYKFFESFSLGISNLVNSIFNIHTDPAVFTSIFIVFLIGALWGIAYGIVRHKTNP